jgi:DNA repair protein RadC
MEDNKYLTVKEWAAEDRPREKLLAKGAKSLSDAELLAIMLGSGTRNLSVVELSRKILESSGNNLHELGQRNVAELMKLKGVGEAKAMIIVAALELGRRRGSSLIPERQQITASRDIFNLMYPYFADLGHEEFWVVLLNRANKVIRKDRVSQGGLTATVTDIRIILKLVLDHQASSVVLCHNHPSGNLQASKADIDITLKITNAANIFDVYVIDHLIFATNNYFSFNDNNLISNSININS